MCEQIFPPRKVLLSEDSCSTEYFGEGNGIALSIPEKAHRTVYTKPTKLKIYLSYTSRIPERRVSPKNTELPCYSGYLGHLVYSFSTVVCIYSSPLNPLSNKYSLMSFCVDVEFLGEG